MKNGNTQNKVSGVSDYDSYKKMLEKRILEELFKYYPKCRNAVDFTLVGSPLTFNYYIGSSKGEVYGLDGSCNRFQINDWLRPELIFLIYI